jgi:F-type H+-transporting ATPase subunit gamma
VSSIKQDVANLQLLPTTKVDEEKRLSPLEVALFEPNADVIIESAARRLIEAQVWQTISESLASEHSARMLAMKNATDNASDIIDDLTLEFNTARQAAITQEIAEIVGGAEAVKVD